MISYAKPEQKQDSKSTVQKKEPEKAVAAPNQTGIPDTMKSGFENLSGFSFDDVRVHYNSDKPAQLQALAYTQGNQVYVANNNGSHSGNQPIQCMKIEDLKAYLGSADFTQDATDEELRQFAEYIKDIPVEKITDNKWQKALGMVFSAIRDGKATFQNPYDLDDDTFLYRGTTLVSDEKKGKKVYSGSGGSANNTPTTISPGIAALFALKRPHHTEGVVLTQTVGTIKSKQVGFSAPDTMSSKEREVTLTTSPETTASMMEMYGVKNFVNALKTVGIDYSDYVASGIETGGAFDALIAKSKILNSEETQQLRYFLRNPGEIALWTIASNSYNNDRNFFQLKIQQIDSKIKKFNLDRDITLITHFKEIDRLRDLYKKDVSLIRDLTERYNKRGENRGYLEAAIFEIEKKIPKSPTVETETGFNLFD